VTQAQFPKQPPKGQVLQRHEERKLERGAMGWLFGMGSEKPANIAGFAIVVSFVAAIAAAFFMTDTASFTKKDAVLGFVSIITLALGFLFGRGSAGS
jgi:hypothetical protein